MWRDHLFKNFCFIETLTFSETYLVAALEFTLFFSLDGGRNIVEETEAVLSFLESLVGTPY